MGVTLGCRWKTIDPDLVAVMLNLFHIVDALPARCKKNVARSRPTLDYNDRMGCVLLALRLLIFGG